MKIIPKIRSFTTDLEKTEGELITAKIARAKKQGEIIKDAAEIIYTSRKAGIIVGHDIRADKWTIRAAAKTTIDVDKLDQREKLMNPEPAPTPGEGSEGKATA